MQAKRTRAARWRSPSDMLVLAAVDRAECHRPTQAHGDPPLSEIARHLAVPWGPVASRRLRPIVERLTIEHGWLKRSRRHGQDRWALTEAGSDRLAQAAVEGVLEELPESPQHCAWRKARAHADERIDALRGELGELLATLDAMLDSHEPVAATEWLACASRLQKLTEAVAVASYCAYERPEPDDAAPDHDDNVALPLRSWRHPRSWDPGNGE